MEIWVQKIQAQTQTLLAENLEQDIQQDVNEILVSAGKLNTLLNTYQQTNERPHDLVHRFRTSLNVVIGFTEILMDSQRLEDKQLVRLQDIHENAEHLLHEVDLHFGTSFP